MLIPKIFVIKCVLDRDAYLNECVFKWEATKLNGNTNYQPILTMMVVVCNSNNHKRKGKEKMKSSTKYKKEGKGQCWVVLRRMDIYLLDINLGICPFIH
jgi:hypothetical protein